MLPYVCSVIDHRWRQNVVRTKKVAHEAIAECVTDVLTSYHILTSSVIYYWTDPRQHGIYLFYIKKKQTTTEKAFLFQNLSTWLESLPMPRTPPTLTNTKKSHLTIVYTKEAISLVAMRSTTVKLDSSVAPRGKQNWTAKFKNREENAGKIEKSFWHQSSPVSWIAWTLPWILQELKK